MPTKRNVISSSKVALEKDTSEIDISTRWSTVLMDEAVCTSQEEAVIMAEVISDELKERGDLVFGPETLVALERILQENMGVLDTKDLAKKLLVLGTPQGCDGSLGEVVGQDDGTCALDIQADGYSQRESDEDEEDGVALFDGECELCDRNIQLTKHHLIPKSTWPRLEVKLMHAAEALEGGNPEKAAMILGPGLTHLTVELQPNKQVIRKIIQRTCDICRSCHSTVHRTHDNMNLALSYNTIKLLLQDKQISNYCKWASKQRVAKYGVVR